MIRTSRKIGENSGVTEQGSDFSRSGFSLIEVLISLVILSVGLLAVAQMQVSAIRGIAFSRHMTSATYLARQQMEYLRALPYDDANPTASPLGAGGNPIQAKIGETNASVLLDDNNGSGAAGVCGDEAWGTTLEHAQNPLNEEGATAAGGGGQFYVLWRVMRGLKNVCTGVDALGPGQMMIEMQVIWWEEEVPEDLDFQNSEWGDLQQTGAHRVMLNTLRQQNL